MAGWLTGRGCLVCALMFILTGCGDDPGARTSESSSATGPPLPAGPVVDPPPGGRAESSAGSAENLAAAALDPFSLPEGLHAASGPLTPSTTTLPVDETYGGNAGFAFRITQEGSGNGGWFRIRSPSSANRMALLATHTGEGLAARAINTGRGRALWAQIPEPSNPFDALVATHVGSGDAMEAINFGTGAAARFEIRNPTSNETVVTIATDATGPPGSELNSNGLRITHNGGRGFGLIVENNTLSGGSAARLTAAGGTAVQAQTNSSSFAHLALDAVVNNASSNAAAIRVRHGGTGPLAEFRTGVVLSTTRAEIANDGEIFSDVGFSTPAADLAESFAVEGPFLRYQPGDVLVISRRSDRRVEKSAGPYSTLVLGVYAESPGIRLGRQRASGERTLPVGVVGVVPTRVSAENGPIRRGDLLVTSTTPGHAMRATESRIRYGSVLGKALEPFDGPGTGLIEVMVNVK